MIIYIKDPLAHLWPPATPTPVQIKCLTFLVAQKNLITFLKKRMILMQDLFATNRRKSNFLHKYNITVIVKALLNEITRLAAHLDH